MAQDSFPWGCTPSVGDAGAVTVNDLVNANQFTGNTQPNEDGVVYWTSTNPLPGGTNSVDGLLAVTLVGTVVSVATGIGMVQGWHFVNDTTVNFDFSADPGNANATDLIVLERGNPATELTVRLARVKGAASTLATVTQNQTLWQVPLAQIPLDGSGLPTSVVRVRRFVGQVMSHRRGGDATDWSVAGTTSYLVGNVKMTGGTVTMTVPSGGTTASTSFQLPVDFVNYPLFFTNVLYDSISGYTNAVVNHYFTAVGTGQVNLILEIIGSPVGVDFDYDVSWLAVGLVES